MTALGNQKELQRALHITASTMDDLDLLDLKMFYPNVPNCITSSDTLLDWLLYTGQVQSEDIDSLYTHLQQLGLETGALTEYSIQFLQQQTEHRKKQKNY